MKFECFLCSQELNCSDPEFCALTVSGRNGFRGKENSFVQDAFAHFDCLKNIAPDFFLIRPYDNDFD
jgi:hypothetical protein